MLGGTNFISSVLRKSVGAYFRRKSSRARRGALELEEQRLDPADSGFFFFTSSGRTEEAPLDRDLLVVDCQPALNIDPRSASKIDPPAWWLVPVVHRGDPRDAECPSRG
jgi:hypothetical protein